MKSFIRKMIFSCYLGLLISFLVIKPVDAYIDPGTGSMLIQIIVGGMMGILVTLKAFGENNKYTFQEKVNNTFLKSFYYTRIF